MPWNILAHGLTGIASIINTAQTNRANLKATRETNEANRQMVEMQNKSAAAEADKAYNRSKASNQVSLMQSAGMSRAGAINALNGGGSYTPAPVNTSQDSAPQMQTADLSAFSNMAQAITANKQMKLQEKLAKEQLEAQKSENAAQREHAASEAKLQRESAERIAQLQADTTNRNADNRLNFDKEQFDRLAPYQIRQIEANIKKINADTNISIHNLKELQYKYAEYVDTRSTRDAISLFQELEATYNIHLTEKDIQDFQRRYMYYDEKTGEYEYIKHTEELTYMESLFRNFWDIVAEIIPANKLAELLRLVFRK